MASSPSTASQLRRWRDKFIADRILWKFRHGFFSLYIYSSSSRCSVLHASVVVLERLFVVDSCVFGAESPSASVAFKVFHCFMHAFAFYFPSAHIFASFVTYLALKLKRLNRKIEREFKYGLFVSFTFFALRQINHSFLYQRFPLFPFRSKIVRFFPVYPCILKYLPPVMAGVPFRIFALSVIL